ncbi:capsule assembly Wzi family protein [Planctomycetota bacterium]
MPLSPYAYSEVSTNVPLDHWAYEILDRLAGQNLTVSSMPSTRPYSRSEMARLIVEAADSAAQTANLPPITRNWIQRLEEEFIYEVDRLRTPNLGFANSHVKPVEDPYLRYVYGKYPFDKENESGDMFQPHDNWRLGFTTRGVLGKHFAYSLRPECRDSAGMDSEATLREGYGKFGLGGLDVEFGKDTLWWGPGRHGAMLISNNAEPYTMLKISNDQPILLPWIFRYLGPFKAVYFVTELEKERYQPQAQFSGLRLNMKPHPLVDFGLSRTIMFGGDNFDIGLWDYLQIFWPKNVQGNENQMSSIDLSIRVPMPKAVPMSSLTVYGIFSGEDSAGFSKYVPSLGLQLNDLLRAGRTDLRFEYAYTHINGFPNTFYQHTIFQSGHTYEGRVMGHHIGTDARDTFVRLTHDFTSDLRLGVDWDQEIGNVYSSPQPRRTQYGIDIKWFAQKRWQLQARYQYEDIKNDTSRPHYNHIADIVLVYDF